MISLILSLLTMLLVVVPTVGPVLLDTKEAATYLGVTRKTMERWRWAGGGPEYFKVGAYVRYSTAALDTWLESRRRRNTSDLGLGAS